MIVMQTRTSNGVVRHLVTLLLLCVRVCASVPVHWQWQLQVDQWQCSLKLPAATGSATGGTGSLSDAVAAVST